MLCTWGVDWTLERRLFPARVPPRAQQTTWADHGRWHWRARSLLERGADAVNEGELRAAGAAATAAAARCTADVDRRSPLPSSPLHVLEVRRDRMILAAAIPARIGVKG